MKYEWSLELKVPRGHRYFKDKLSGAIAVADDSGCFPDQTDDGVLWLMVGQPMQVDDLKDFVRIAVRSEKDKEQTYVMETPRCAIMVARHFNIKVQTMEGSAFHEFKRDLSAVRFEVIP